MEGTLQEAVTMLGICRGIWTQYAWYFSSVGDKRGRRACVN